MHNIRKLLVSVGMLGCSVACGGPKEAEDPRNILGEDLEHEGVSGAGAAPDSPRQPAARPPPPPGHKLATRAECEAAARHVVKLGAELAIADETDPEKRKQLEAQRSRATESQEARDYIASLTEECLSEGTTQRKAKCMAQVRSQADIDRCVPQ